MAAVELDLSWAPLKVSIAGVPEVDASWLYEHADDVSVIDVREPDEYRGELGHVPQAELVPLGALPAASHGLPRDRPLVVICRSGGRSGRAAMDLAQMGFARVASLQGGMREWQSRKLPVQYGPASLPSRQG
jgi:rhodanese-related sulfurtransferase